VSDTGGPVVNGPLTVLATGAAALARSTDLDAALAAILGSAGDAVGADLTALFVQDPDRAHLELVAARGFTDEGRAAFEAEVVGGADHPIARSARDRAVVLGRTGVAADGTALTGADLPLVIARGGIDQSLGVLSFGWAGTHEIGASEADLLRAVADLAAVAIDHARVASLASERAEWFERMAHTDPLTGLANARTLHRVLDLEVTRSSRQGGEISVAVFDVDDFVAANAAAGSRAGDTILREVAAVLSESVRLVDTVARTGSDEFVLVAPGSAGLTVARRVLDGIASLPEVEGRPISVSAGVARFPVDGTDGEGLLAAARAAVERARATGSGPVAEAARGSSA
jgi:diguanylate cyclase (GGDEF)-like protein